MIRVFQCREFGVGREVTLEELQQVTRKGENEYYLGESAAVLKQGTKKKQPLTTSPSYTEFEYRAQKEGYWTYKHFVLQCEDVADCLEVLYPQFSFMFLVYH